MNRRSRGREIALQVLYQIDQNPSLQPAEIARFISRRLREPVLREFAQTLVDGVRKNQSEIDTLISEVAENWRIDRMAAIDRNILRLGAFEIVLREDIPAKVAITEGLELAKRYSTAQSSRFVNGILDRLQVRSTDAQQAKARALAVAKEHEKESLQGTGVSGRSSDRTEDDTKILGTPAPFPLPPTQREA